MRNEILSFLVEQQDEAAINRQLLRHDVQHPLEQLIRIDDRDAISDSGQEIFNLLRARGVKHVLMCGVHTNMCVLGRPFGLRQMARNGINVVLVRDMTDTMYNPAMWPYVNHHTGTDFIMPRSTLVQFIEGAGFEAVSRYQDYSPVRPDLDWYCGCSVCMDRRVP